MNNFLSANKENVPYDPKKDLHNRGRKIIHKDLGEQSEIVYSGLSAGLSVCQTTILLNEWRHCHGELEPVCMSVVQRFAQKSKVIHISRRLTEKAGSLDEK